MMTARYKKAVLRGGSALAAAVMLLVVVVAVMTAVSALAASRASTASMQQKEDRALTSARSGADIILYILQQMRASERTASGTTTVQLREELQAGLSNLEVTGVYVELKEQTVCISSVTLNDSTGQSFNARLTSEDGKNVIANVTGRAGDVTRKLRLKCNLATGAHLVYDPAEIPSRS
jgi:hypothetical protein